MAIDGMDAVQKRAKSMAADIVAKYSSAADQALEQSENHNPASMAPPTPRLHSQSYQVFPHPSNPHIVMDSCIMPRLLAQPDESAPQSIGVITDVEVNRKGGLSCPVRTGAVLACCHVPSTSTLHDAAAESLHGGVDSVDQKMQTSSPTAAEPEPTEASISETLKEACAQALDEFETAGLAALRHCDSFGMLEQLVASGKVPPLNKVTVHRSHTFFQGVTAEFKPTDHGFSKVTPPRYHSP
jgi:hypothetical protein